LCPIDALERLTINFETVRFKSFSDELVRISAALRAHTSRGDFQAKVIEITFSFDFQGWVCHEISIILRDEFFMLVVLRLDVAFLPQISRIFRAKRSYQLY
jgi:hypothetical protein